MNISFFVWLVQQWERQDSVGELSRYVRRDNPRPSGRADLAEWKAYIAQKSHNDPKWTQAFEKACEEYSKA